MLLLSRRVLLVCLAIGLPRVSGIGYTAAQRFDGFRYEIKGTPPDFRAVQTHIVKVADQLSCFGWVQRSPADTVVGEARCNKEGGRLLRSYLQRGVMAAYGENDVHASIHPYPDTNIKLHFSDFRKLDPSRRTCFDNMPHACSLYEGTGAGTAEKVEL